MAKVIGIVAVKGGVGKTTIASALATDLANHFGKKVLLVDANYSSPHIALHMNIENPTKTVHDVVAGRARISSAINTNYGVDVITGDYLPSHKINPFKLKSRLDAIKKNYDFIVIDASPSVNEELLSAFVASDCLFMVSTPDEPTLTSSLKTALLAKHRNTPVHGIILNKLRDPNYELTLQEIESATGIPVVAMIHDDKTVGRAIYTRIPVPLYKRHSQFSKQISAISAVVTGEKQEISFFRDLFGLPLKPEEVNREIVRGFYESPLR
jgi:septum site-determining protein MinD